jgi:quinol monooxygenase YgiN
MTDTTTPTGDQALVVTATFHPAEGKREQVLAAMERVIPRVHEEPGCNLYAIQEAEDGTIIMIEHWDSAALLDEHGAGAPVAEFNQELEGLLASPIAVTRYTPIPMGDARKGVVVG